MLDSTAAKPPAKAKRFNPLTLILLVILAVAGITGIAVAATAATPHSACPADVAFMAYTDGTWITCAATIPPPTGPTTTPPGPSGSPLPTGSPTPTISVSPSISINPGITCPVAGTGVPGAKDPWGGCFPGPGNTGTPAGTVLHACTSPIKVSGTYDSCLFVGSVEVYAPNVKITRSRIQGQTASYSTGLLISDTTIACGCPSTATETPPAIMESNFTLLRVDLSGSGHGVAAKDNVTVRDSWIHGLVANNEAHKDGIYVGDGSNSTIRHNSVECNDGSAGGCTSAIGLLDDFSNITHFTITYNLLNTNGSYCFYGGAKIPAKAYHSEYIVFTDNVFGRAIYLICGYYGPVTYFDITTVGNVWARNAYTDGKPVAAEN